MLRISSLNRSYIKIEHIVNMEGLLMNTAGLEQCYGDLEDLKGEDQNYFLIRLTDLYGEECLNFLDEDEDEEDQDSEN